jgi:hypothetical protein
MWMPAISFLLELCVLAREPAKRLALYVRPGNGTMWMLSPQASAVDLLNGMLRPAGPYSECTHAKIEQITCWQCALSKATAMQAHNLYLVIRTHR